MLVANSVSLALTVENVVQGDTNCCDIVENGSQGLNVALFICFRFFTDYALLGMTLYVFWASRHSHRQRYASGVSLAPEDLLFNDERFNDLFPT